MTHKKPPQTPPELSDEGDADLAAFSEALSSALRPTDIDADLHEAILARALSRSAGKGSVEEEAETPASDAEAQSASVLASLIEGGALKEGTSGSLVRLAELARALRLAYAPAGIDEITHQRVLGAGLKTPTRTASRRTVAGAVFVLVAAAAAIFGLYLQRKDAGPGPATATATGPRAPLIEARSSMELFDAMKPFDREKGTTERIDKITSTRASELRDNQFNAWGIQ
jgi:hypothetical protein